MGRRHADDPAVDDLVPLPRHDETSVDGELVARVDRCQHRHSADFVTAIDMLTRTSELNDFAPDASVFPRARHPVTGGRQLEHVAFEIASSETLADCGVKARELVRRGVRRVFAIDIDPGPLNDDGEPLGDPVSIRCHEWARELDGWHPLDPDTVIADRVFAVPLPVAALTDPSLRLRDMLANALQAKR
jgi:hypothetical protein